MFDFFTLWATQVWGSVALSVLATIAIYAIICAISRMGLYLSIMLLIMPIIAFSTIVWGLIVFVPLFILALFYFVSQSYLLYTRRRG